MNPDQIPLAERLEELGKGVGSVSQLARLCQINQRTMAGYVSGGYEPRASDLLKIAKATNVNVEWLLTGDGPKSGETATPAKQENTTNPDIADEINRELWMIAIEMMYEIALKEKLVKYFEPAGFARIVNIVVQMEIDDFVECKTQGKPYVINKAKYTKMMKNT
jgi:transcriptional regulator with XRE-family HTH domain